MNIYDFESIKVIYLVSLLMIFSIKYTGILVNLYILLIVSSALLYRLFAFVCTFSIISIVITNVTIPNTKNSVVNTVFIFANISIVVFMFFDLINI